MSSTKTVQLTVTQQKRAVAKAMIHAIATDLSKRNIQGVSRDDALRWAGELCNYFPGARTDSDVWDSRLGVVSQAGAAKKKTPAPAPKPRKRTPKPATPSDMPATQAA